MLTNLAGVYSEVAAYEFTTLTTVPGVIRYKGAKIQVNINILCALVDWYTGTLVDWYTSTLVDWYTGTLVDWYTGTLVHWYIG